MIPDLRRKEWAEILNGSMNPKLTSFSFQMKLNSLKLEIKIRKINLEEAIAELHRFVSANEQLYQKDVKTIFNLF